MPFRRCTPRINFRWFVNAFEQVKFHQCDPIYLSTIFLCYSISCHFDLRPVQKPVFYRITNKCKLVNMKKLFQNLFGPFAFWIFFCRIHDHVFRKALFKKTLLCSIRWSYFFSKIITPELDCIYIAVQHR